MLLDSITHAKDDVTQRMLIEARVEGEAMVRTVETFLQKNPDQVSVTEISETHKYLQVLKDALTSGDKDNIHKAIDELNEFTRPFAERLMDHAISHAMKGKSIE